ncbi:MAG TPA: MBL fold metallo-hydrolase [Microvirga sp.]|nr:MBL fold metallo-hydrolase [Microvirga sp.]
MNLRLTILGCGSSGGVPRVGAGWGACNPANPKNRRRRCSMLVERIGPDANTTVLVDTSPDLREQLLSADVKRLDGILFTHDHADHSHGIDDVRPLVIAMRRRIPAYLDEATSALLVERFSYCFQSPPGSPYPPILEERRLEAGSEVAIDGAAGPLVALPFRLLHGVSDALGFRFGPLLYAPDVSRIPDESIRYFLELEVLIIDALRYTPHPSHFSVDEALAVIEEVRPKRAILTNLHTDLDYDVLRAQLPAHVEPAYDGLQIEVRVRAAVPV